MNILCYGDSNTWGYVPNVNGYSKDAVMQRYDDIDCWWYPLRQGNDLFVDGLCGRCIAHENRWLENRNALLTIKEDLAKYKDLDLIIFQLGTNDCKTEYKDSPEKITENFERLLSIVERITKAKVLIISPAQIREDNKITCKYYVGANKKSIDLNKSLENFSIKNNFYFVSGLDLDVGEDGEHLTKFGHRSLGNKVFEVVSFIEMNNNFQNF